MKNNLFLLLKYISGQRFSVSVFICICFFGITQPAQAQLSISGTLYENNGTTVITTGKTITAAIATSTPSLHSATSNGSGAYTISGIATSTGGTSWTARGAAAINDDSWQDVTYGNGLFVAVGFGGSDFVMTSPDGITWTARSAAGNNDGWTGVTYGNGLFVAVGYTGDRVMTSPDGITWTARTAAGDNDLWQAVTYGNGQFVAVSCGGSFCGVGGDRVMTSPDGITWTALSVLGNNDSWQAITYGNGLFVAAGGGGDVVMTSPDGITWTARSAAGNNDGWQEITFGNDLFVAVGNWNDRVMTSPDGITWTARTAVGNNDSWYGVTYGNGLFVAVDNSGDRVMNSIDGINWATSTAVGADDFWNNVTYGNGIFVAVGYLSGDRIMTASAGFGDSTPITLFVDGDTTKAAILTYGPRTTVSSITGADLFKDTVRLQHSSTSGSINLANADFYDYDQDRDISFDSDSATTSVGGLATTTHLIVATGTMMQAPQHLELYGDFTQGGQLNSESGITYFYGPDPSLSGSVTASSSLNDVVVNPVGGGKTWTVRSAAGNDDGWYDITYGNGTFVAVANTSGSDRVMYSTDGITWATTSAAGNDDEWDAVTYGNGKFVAVGYLGDRVMYSTDGITWATTSAAGNDDSWDAVTYGNGTFVAVSDGPGSDRVMYSTDGITWATTSAAGNDDEWDAVTYGNGKFVAVGYLGDRVMYSTDGITWATTSAAGNDDAWDGIAYGNGRFVAVGEVGDRVMYSTDGITWATTSAAGNNDEWLSVTFGNDRFVAVSQSGDNVMYSMDGITWATTSAAGNNDIWYAVTYGNGTFVAVGDAFTEDGVMTSSGDLQVPGEAQLDDVTVSQNKGLWTNSNLTVSGNLSNSGTIQNTGTLLMTGASKLLNARATTTASASIGNVTIVGSTTLQSVASTTNLTVATSGALTSTSSLSIAGNFTQNGLLNFASSTLAFDGTTQTISGNLTDSNTLSNVALQSPFTWTRRTSPQGTAAFRSVTYGEGRFVAVNCRPSSGVTCNSTVGNRVIYSDDGITWATTTAAGDDDRWTTVRYANGRFVAVGNASGDRVMYSDDGITWATTSAAGNDDSWFSLTYGNGRWVAAGTGPDRVMYSDDNGVTWATTTSTVANNESWRALAYGNGMFVAGALSGTNRLMTSPDGITWTARSVAGNNDGWFGLTFGNGRFVALSNGGTGSYSMYSFDGITWVESSITGDNEGWSGITYGSGLFVAVVCGNPSGCNTTTGTDRVAYSVDGVTWVSASSVGNNEAWRDVVFGEDRFVAVSESTNANIMSLDVFPKQFVSNVDVANLDIAFGTPLVLSSSTPVTLRVGGNYTNQGLLTASTSGVVFRGTAQQTATGTLSGASAFYDLTLSNTSQNGSSSQSVIFGTPLTVSDTFTMQASTSARFISSATATLQNIDLQGTLSSPVWLRSSNSGTKWGIDVPGSQLNVRFVNVQDSRASTSIVATNGTDSGNNVNWSFVTAVGSSTIANHTATQVSNAFNFQNKTNEELFAFQLTPNSGTATVTDMTFILRGVKNVLSSDFTNLRLLRDYDNDATYDATDGAVGGTGVMSITGTDGTITFTEDFFSTTTQNYLLVADFNAPANGSYMSMSLERTGLIAIDNNGTQQIFGSVSSVQHNRNNKGGGATATSDVGGAPPAGNTPQTGGGGGGGEQIGNDPNFKWPSAHSGSWINGANAYDRTNDTYAEDGTSGLHNYTNHNFGISEGNQIIGIELKLEARGGNSSNISAQLSWDGGASWTSFKTTADLVGVDAVQSLGGNNDLWGRSWSPSEFSNANFAVRITNPDLQVYLDEIQVRVYYQTTGGGGGSGGDI